MLAFLNSKVTPAMVSLLNPTMHINPGDVAKLPFPQDEALLARAGEIATECCQIARSDWDSSETSWEFAGNPLLRSDGNRFTMGQAMVHVEESHNARLRQMEALESENNSLFIKAYGLGLEVSRDVPPEEITLRHFDRAEEIRRVTSYTIGSIMGRYSLDRPGLIYAYSGNEGFDLSQYKTFRADDDGIIPLPESDWGIRDDATNRFVEFIGVAWPKVHLEENLKFVADSLGPNNGEQPRDTIRRYLATGFFKHHLSMYKKRPIYWLFSSGKQRAFQCLVYLHRYHEGTLARMRTEYVIPLQGQIAARIEQFEGDKAKATSSSHRNKIQKEQDRLKKQQTELATFEEKLKHAADQKISLDLDDGVKVNYAKFGDLLAEAKAITGGKEEE